MTEQSHMADRKFPYGKPYDLSTLVEWVRLLREVAGYIKTCRGQHHGTDLAGRMNAYEALGGLTQILANECAHATARRWRHIRSGGSYAEIARGVLEADAKTRMVVYVADSDQRVWIRPEAEFEDGRFAEILP